MKYTMLMSMIALLSLSAVACAQNAESVQKQVYTSGVTIIKKAPLDNSGAATSSVATNDAIASVGNYDVVAGELPEGFVAFVKEGGNSGYFIKDTIGFSCVTQNCVPGNITAKQIGKSNYYLVQVANYEQWVEVMDILKNAKNNEQKIKDIKPDYFHGIDPKLQ